MQAVGPEPLAAGTDGDNSGGAFTCVLVNATTGLQIPSDAKDTIIEAFRRVTREGMCQDPWVCACVFRCFMCVYMFVC